MPPPAIEGSVRKPVLWEAATTGCVPGDGNVEKITSDSSTHSGVSTAIDLNEQRATSSMFVPNNPSINTLSEPVSPCCSPSSKRRGWRNPVRYVEDSSVEEFLNKEQNQSTDYDQSCDSDASLLDLMDDVCFSCDSDTSSSLPPPRHTSTSDRNNNTPKKDIGKKTNSVDKIVITEKKREDRSKTNSDSVNNSIISCEAAGQQQLDNDHSRTFKDSSIPAKNTENLGHLSEQGKVTEKHKLRKITPQENKNKKPKSNVQSIISEKDHFKPSRKTEYQSERSRDVSSKSKMHRSHHSKKPDKPKPKLGQLNTEDGCEKTERRLKDGENRLQITRKDMISVKVKTIPSDKKKERKKIYPMTKEKVSNISPDVGQRKLREVSEVKISGDEQKGTLEKENRSHRRNRENSLTRPVKLQDKANKSGKSEISKESSEACSSILKQKSENENARKVRKDVCGQKRGNDDKSHGSGKTTGNLVANKAKCAKRRNSPQQADQRGQELSKTRSSSQTEISPCCEEKSHKRSKQNHGELSSNQNQDKLNSVKNGNSSKQLNQNKNSPNPEVSATLQEKPECVQTISSENKRKRSSTGPVRREVKEES